MARWSQFHADGPSQGFIPVSTAPALEPKWSLEVGAVGYGSPVIGLDGTVYIGTMDGNLVAVDRSGAEKWRRSLNQGNSRTAKIIGSPAVGKDGNIYVITTINLKVHDHRGGRDRTIHQIRSTLHNVDPTGNRRWSFIFPENSSPLLPGGFSMSSPKVWGDSPVIFVPCYFGTSSFSVDLLAIDQAGTLIHRTEVANYPPEPITGSGPSLGEIWDGIWDFISSPVDFDESGVGTSLEDQFGWPEPTLAVVDFSPFANRPLIIIEDNYKKLSAFRWQNQRLEFVWKNDSAEARQRSSPAVFSNKLLAVGQKDGTVALFDVQSGRELWKPWYKADKPVMSPQSSFGRQIFLTAGKKLIVLDSNSEFLQHYLMFGKALGSPAMSANYVYVSATDGLYSFSFDLQSFSRNGQVFGGVSSPAIADDGTVYVMGLDKKLWAFGGSTATNPTPISTPVVARSRPAKPSK